MWIESWDFVISEYKQKCLKPVICRNYFTWIEENLKLNLFFWKMKETEKPTTQ